MRPTYDLARLMRRWRPRFTAVVDWAVPWIIAGRSAARQNIGLKLDSDNCGRNRRDHDIEIVFRLVEIGVVAGAHFGLTNRAVDRRSTGPWCAATRFHARRRYGPLACRRSRTLGTRRCILIL